MQATVVILDITSITQSTEWTDAIGRSIASQQSTIVRLAERVRGTVALCTLFIFDGTIRASVVVLAETDVSSGVVAQRLTEGSGWTRMRRTRIAIRWSLGEMQDFGKAKDRQMIEEDGVLPYSDHRWTAQLSSGFVGFDADRVRLCLDELRSIVVALHAMLSKVR